MYHWKSIYFCGNKVSNYGIQNKRVDYATLAKSFDCVLNNDIMNKTSDIGYWETVNGSEYYYETTSGKYFDSTEEIYDAIDNLKETINDTEQGTKEYNDLLNELDELENANQNLYYHDIYQYYIISDAGANILKEYTNEIVFYNDELDMYIWGVTHYGTSWDYVLTDIIIETEEK